MYVSSASSVAYVTPKKVRRMHEFTNEAALRGYHVAMSSCVGEWHRQNIVKFGKIHHNLLIFCLPMLSIWCTLNLKIIINMHKVNNLSKLFAFSDLVLPQLKFLFCNNSTDTGLPDPTAWWFIQNGCHKFRISFSHCKHHGTKCH